tara:strand:+ start:14144 stop:14416 length:273 start_codon:yes stop_codon:yes gene_type:complete
MKINLSEISIKEVFMVGGLVVALSGFYYTTQLRITALEETNTSSLGAERRLLSVEQQVKGMDKKIDFLYDAVLWSIENQSCVSSYNGDLP